MSRFSDDELYQIAKLAAQKIIYPIEALVKSMTLDELRAAREILDDQLYGEKYADSKGGVALTPIDEERRKVQRSTFEGSSNPDLSARYGWALPALLAKITKLFNSGDARKIASAYILTNTYDRLKGAMEPDLTHLSKAVGASPEGQGCPACDNCPDPNCAQCVSCRSYREKDVFRVKAANLSRPGFDHEGRKLNREVEERRRFYAQADDDELEIAADVNERIRATDNLCPGFPPCTVDHESMSPDEYVRHVEG